MINSQFKEYAEKAPNSTLLSENVFQNILENTFAVLISQEEIHSVDYSSNENAKGFYAFLLTVTTDLIRHDSNLEEIEQFFTKSCGIAPSRVQKYLEYYEKNKNKIMFSLLNVGTYLPHLNNIRWKVDYIMKSSMVEEPEGPLFRISLLAEKFDDFNNSNTIKNINFTCTTQELQDLVYKLKDALRHCNTITNRIS